MGRKEIPKQNKPIEYSTDVAVSENCRPDTRAVGEKMKQWKSEIVAGWGFHTTHHTDHLNRVFSGEVAANKQRT